MNCFPRYTLCIGTAVALLAGCGGSQPPTATSPSGAVPFVFTHHKTFRYTGKKQTFNVPSGVTQIRVIALGASGGGIRMAFGGRVNAVIPVTPSEMLAIYVGGAGTSPRGGFNGGGAGGQEAYGSLNGYGGGGASDVREGGEARKDRVVVAGGGGGQGAGDSDNRGFGGKGGTLTGGSGKGGYRWKKGPGGGGGTGGTQVQGGTGGVGAGTSASQGANGRLAHGGGGGTGCFSSSSSSHCGYGGGSGGGGGGGFYGGGGGGGGAFWGCCGEGGGGGGGGGSSYAEPSATGVQMWRGWKTASGDGLIVLRW